MHHPLSQQADNSMHGAFDQFLNSSQQRVESTLASLLAAQLAGAAAEHELRLSQTLHDAMHYCLLNGGKRVRACLVYAAGEAAEGPSVPPALDQIAAGLECLHAYSLIHDDLPAMDDDDLRRGLPSCHKAYDEATAILTGDALQSLSFELLADCPALPAAQRLQLIKTLARAAGPNGMVGGQYIDLNIDRERAGLTQLETLHSLKTGALIRAAVRLGAIASGASTETLQALDHYARAIGLAFQVKDDILDIEGSTAALGKHQGSDIANDKLTYPALLGLDGARQHLARLLQQALCALSPLGGRTGPLRQLAEYIVDRAH